MLDATTAHPNYPAYAAICLHCPHVEKTTAQVRHCTVNGKWFLENAHAGECPKNLFVLKTDAVAQPTIHGVAAAPLLPHPKPWPILAQLIAAKRQPQDKGLGDTIARIMDPKGGKLFKRLYKRITGEECGCADRQARLNAIFKYD